MVQLHNKPQVEAGKHAEVILNPVVILWNENRVIMIKPLVKSVCMSIKSKQANELEEVPQQHSFLDPPSLPPPPCSLPLSLSSSLSPFLLPFRWRHVQVHSLW